WACERTTASMEEAANGRLRFLRSASLRRPWLSPQSRRKRRPPDSTRCMEPVTPPAAPQNVSFIKAHGSASAKQQGEVLFGLWGRLAACGRVVHGLPASAAL